MWEKVYDIAKIIVKTYKKIKRDCKFERELQDKIDNLIGKYIEQEYGVYIEDIREDDFLEYVVEISVNASRIDDNLVKKIVSKKIFQKSNQVTIVSSFVKEVCGIILELQRENLSPEAKILSKIIFEESSALSEKITSTVQKANTKDSLIEESLELADNIRISKEYIEQSLMLPWLSSKSISFSEFYSGRLFINPKIVNMHTRIKEKIKFENLVNKYKKSGGKICVLGHPGVGKTTLLKQICLDSINNGDNSIFITATELAKNKHQISDFVFNLINGNVKCDESLSLFIDGLDEAYAHYQSHFKELLFNLRELKCTVWVACRINFYENAIDENYFKCVELIEWSRNNVVSFLKKYYKGNLVLCNKIMNFVDDDDGDEKLFYNPLHLSILMCILENDLNGSLKINNKYCLYDTFYTHWVLHENKRNTSNIDKDDIFAKHFEIAKLLYFNEYAVIDDKGTAITGILKTSRTGNDGQVQVDGFSHRTLLEFILAKNLINCFTANHSENRICEELTNPYMSDISSFVKAYFNQAKDNVKSEVAQNLIASYIFLEKSSANARTLYFTKSQLLYYLTRLDLRNNIDIEIFLKRIFENETETLIQQGIAYGSANMALFDIALDFARKITPNSKEDITNRSWTLVWYKDKPNEDAFVFKDDGKCDWTNSREARLERLQSSHFKDESFRMFDLRILYTFFVSRNWCGVNEKDYKILCNCNVNIDKFPNEVNVFLSETKNQLVCKYKEALEQCLKTKN